VRYWSVAEARAYLPRLRELISAVRDAVGVATRSHSNGHGGSSSGIDAAAALEELAEGEIVLRDPERGLIDFRALGADGVVYLLCWQLGEDDLAWWHLPEEGFAGRKPLPRNESGS
jgi:hypothetical protein